MTTNQDKDNNQTTNQDKDHKSGNQGFASMPKDQVQDIASKGGQSGSKDHSDNNQTSDHKDQDGRKLDHKDGDHKSGKQGFASMPKDQVKDIASKGGQSS